MAMFNNSLNFFKNKVTSLVDTNGAQTQNSGTGPAQSSPQGAPTTLPPGGFADPVDTFNAGGAPPSPNAGTTSGPGGSSFTQIGSNITNMGSNLGNNIGAFGGNMAAGATALFGSLTSSTKEGVSSLFTSVSEKKNGLVGEISTKFDQLTRLVNVKGKDEQGAGPGGAGQAVKKERKKKEKKPKAEGEGDSSASEYGDEGDKPTYSELGAQGAESDEDLDDYAKEVKAFMVAFTEKLFAMRFDATPPEQQKFEEYVRDGQGRLIFAKIISKNHGSNDERVEESAFNRLVQRLGGVLRDSNELDDYLPPALLLRVLFNVYFENNRKQKVYLHSALRDFPIFQSLRFWNAAFDESLRREKRRTALNRKGNKAPSLEEEEENHQKATFNVLSMFNTYMLTFDITKDVCQDFSRKQAETYGLKPDKYRSIKNQIQQWAPAS